MFISFKWVRISPEMDWYHYQCEMDNSENGPLLQHADNIIERAMNKYWMQNRANGKWHFINRRGELWLKKSKVLQRLRKQKFKLASMDKYNILIMIVYIK